MYIYKYIDLYDIVVVQLFRLINFNTFKLVISHLLIANL